MTVRARGQPRADFLRVTKTAEPSIHRAMVSVASSYPWFFGYPRPQAEEGMRAI
jgi:hypothetical protein